MTIDERIISKYTFSVPRYTSYPPVPYWKITPTAQQWLANLTLDQKDQKDQKDQNQQEVQVQVYVHIPFCHALCPYCGCYRVHLPSGTVDNQLQLIDNYLDDLLREWTLYLDALEERDIDIRKWKVQMHIGGGTPNILSAQQLARFLDSFFRDKKGHKIRCDYGSIEINPTYLPLNTNSKAATDDDFFQVLASFGFKKISLGIQDFNPHIQKIIGRNHSADLIEDLVVQIRKQGFEAINFDLICGLPGQTLFDFNYNIKQLERLRPDSVAYYNYAYIPTHAPLQQRLQEFAMMDDKDKFSSQIFVAQQMQSLKYLAIGLDHYVLQDDRLANAYRQGKLIRNFMGYSVGTNTSAAGVPTSIGILGIGASSISSSKKYFVQNHKDLAVYHQSLMAGQLAIARGHTRGDLDLLVDTIIQEIMCYHQVSNLNVRIEQLVSLSQGELTDTKLLQRLDDMQKDGLIELQYKNSFLRVTALGKFFLRNVALAFDYLFERAQRKSENDLQQGVEFSRTL
ncbi:MAG: coproporphyrinogen dehydrogenase [Oligoflexia bacterium]|nr:coproporphyrinogen dehydrogenase [Oligoflexia bacterium]